MTDEQTIRDALARLREAAGRLVEKWDEEARCLNREPTMDPDYGDQLRKKADAFEECAAALRVALREDETV